MADCLSCPADQHSTGEVPSQILRSVKWTKTPVQSIITPRGNFIFRKREKRQLTNLPLILTTPSPKSSVPNLHSLRLFSGMETVSTNPRLPTMGSLPCTSSWMWFTPLRRMISSLSDSGMVDRRLRHNLAKVEAFDLSLCEWKLSQHQYLGKQSRVNWQDGHRLTPQEEVRNGSKLTGWTQTYSTGRSQEWE